jgi:hypothetical protein
MGLHGAAMGGTVPPSLVWAQEAQSHASSSQVYSHVKIEMPKKAPVNLSSGRSVKH